MEKVGFEWVTIWTVKPDGSREIERQVRSACPDCLFRKHRYETDCDMPFAFDRRSSEPAPVD